MAPRILGIVNLTADSFSDGGLYLDPQRAIAHARVLARDGADVIDLGPASSRPGAAVVSAEEEIRRLSPVLDPLAGEGLELSVDSSQVQTQRFALARGVAWLNDVCGFAEPALHAELAAAACRLIVMHSVPRGEVAPRGHSDVWPGVLEFFERRLSELVRAGVSEARIVLDPGMGLFLGPQLGPSVEVLRRLPELRRRFGRELLVSVSRKSFLGELTGRPVHERAAATLAAELFAAVQGVDWIRTHDVRALRDALRITAALGPR